MAALVQGACAYIGPYLLVAHLVGFAVYFYRKQAWSRGAILTLPLVVPLIPAGGLPLVAYLRAWIGDLSVVTLLLLGAALWRRLGGKRLIDAASLQGLQIAAVAGGFLLYPMTLGLSMIDPYRLGYQDGGDGFHYLASGRLLVLREDRLDEIYDQQVRITVDVEDASGATATDERVVRAIEATEIPDGPDAGP